jgi:hypothetical protein
MIDNKLTPMCLIAAGIGALIDGIILLVRPMSELVSQLSPTMQETVSNIFSIPLFGPIFEFLLYNPLHLLGFGIANLLVGVYIYTRLEHPPYKPATNEYGEYLNKEHDKNKKLLIRKI